MRILYIDVDSLRPDHLGCYGYHRNTSPNIDALAQTGTRFDNLYASDAPCLPSRTALWSGRFGFKTGVVDHGGTASQPFIEGANRSHQDLFGRTGWMPALRNAGLFTATISSFGERHAAWHWYANYNEIHNPGKRGLEIADDVTPLALQWIKSNAQRDDWFLHVNYWDPHTPYRTPTAFGDPFAGDPLPAWITEEVRQRAWSMPGPHSAQEPHGFGDEDFIHRYPRLPARLDSMDAVRQWIDGYDTGVRYVDEHIGRLMNALADAGVLDETLVMIGADHGENLGELNIWGDHQTADNITCRVPLIVHAPLLGSDPRTDDALHYHFDWAATLIELAGGTVPANWDGKPFTAAFRAGESSGRPYLALSQSAWSIQRSVRFEQWLCLQTYHNVFRPFAPVELYDLAADPHEQRDLAAQRPDVVQQGRALLAEWQYEMALTSQHNVDPIMTSLREGGPLYMRGQLPAYAEHLKATGREDWAAWLIANGSRPAAPDAD